jgi:hypothetical protein
LSYAYWHYFVVSEQANRIRTSLTSQLRVPPKGIPSSSYSEEMKKPYPSVLTAAVVESIKWFQHPLTDSYHPI